MIIGKSKCEVLSIKYRINIDIDIDDDCAERKPIAFGPHFAFFAFARSSKQNISLCA